MFTYLPTVESLLQSLQHTKQKYPYTHLYTCIDAALIGELLLKFTGFSDQATENEENKGSNEMLSQWSFNTFRNMVKFGQNTKGEKGKEMVWQLMSPICT